MEEALRAVLLGSAAVTAIAGARVNWGEHPQGAALPGIILTVVSDVEGHTIGAPNGVSAARVQVDCQGASYGSAKQLARAVRTVIDGYRGGLIQAVLLASVRDGREGGTDEADRPFRTSLDVIVHYSTS